MSQDGQGLAVVAFPMPPGTVFDSHSHPCHQIIWSDEGVIEVAAGAALWVLAPTRALWMPAGVEHETRGRDASRLLRGAYLEVDDCPLSWPEPIALEVTPLVAALLVHLGSDDLEVERRARAEAVLYDLLEPAAHVSLELVMPSDDRARAVADGLLADPADGRALAEWGHEVGASARTLSRLFVEETGTSFGSWRATARTQAALDLLATGMPVSRVGERVGYETPSAFVAAFRRVTGTTPGSFFRRG